MATTNNLSISLVAQSQAQKEVTVNTAISVIDAVLNTGVIDRETATPPASPAEGDIYIVGASATGDWAGHDDELAYYNSGWKFISPNEGMTIWVNDEDKHYTYDGSGWVQSDAADNLETLGINATADTTNRLTVKSDAVLFDHDGDDSQVKVNKNAAGDTASHLFQTGFSGRAEFGLIGDDDFRLKVSADGSSFDQVFVADKDNGNIDFAQDVAVDGNFRGKREIVAVSSSKTLALSDAETFQQCTGSSAVTITVPPNSSVAFTVGTEIDILREGTGAVDIAAGTGVTINSVAGNLDLAAQYSTASLKKTATDIWVLYGDLA